MALKAFLTQVLEVPEEIATTEAEHMKYAVSEEYIASIINLEELDCCYNGKRKQCRECERAKNHKKERSK